MQVTAKCDFVGTQSASMKPVLGVLVATGAGVAAIASPLPSFRQPARPLLAASPPAVSLAEFRENAAFSLAPPEPVVPRPRSPSPAREAAGLRPPPESGLTVRPAKSGLSETFLRAFSEELRLAASTVPAEVPPLASGHPPVGEPLALIEAEVPAIAAVGPGAPMLETTSLALRLEPARPVGLEAPLVEPVAERPAAEGQLAPPAPALPPLARPKFAAVPPADGAGSGAALRSPRTSARPATIARIEPRTGQVPLAMPAAELKAMMSAMVSRRPASFDAEVYSDRPAPQPDRAQSLDGPASAAAPGLASSTAQGIEFAVPARVNGVPAGEVPLRIADGENISVRLGDILALLEPKMDRPAYDALTASRAAGEYVTLNRLRASGIAVRFDAKDRLILTAR